MSNFINLQDGILINIEKIKSITYNETFNIHNEIMCEWIINCFNGDKFIIDGFSCNIKDKHIYYEDTLKRVNIKLKGFINE